MVRNLFIDKVPFCASTLGLVSILLTGFLTSRPNRIALGREVAIWQIHSDLGIVILVFWFLLVAASFMPAVRLRRITSSAISAVLLLMLFAAAGRHASVTAETLGSIARISLGPGFWVPLFALIVIITDVQQKSGHGDKIISLILLATSASVVWMFLAGSLDNLSIMREFANRKDRFFDEMLTHILLVLSSVGLALALGMPLGLLAHRKKRLYDPTFFILNTLQTVPSLALFGLLIPLLAALTLRFPFLSDLGIRGIGTAPAIIALTVYSLLPVARNTYTGFATVDPAATEAGLGMGMTQTQLLFKVEIPIASPVILNGIRVALVQAIGLTSVAALIGAGGFGVFIFQGLGQAANDLILLGAIPTIIIAVMADSMMSGVISAVKPEGMK